MRKDPLLWLLLLTIALVIYATLYPFRFQPLPHRMLHWDSARTTGTWMDIVMNVYFFMPIGLLAGIRFRSQTGMLVSFLGCVLLTLSVETAQAFIPGRFSSLRDVALNSLGGFLGLLLAHLPIFDRDLLGSKLESMLNRRGEAILLAAYTVLLYFPFIPFLRLGKLREFLREAQLSPWYDPSTFESILLAFLASQLLRGEGRWGRVLIPLLLLVSNPVRVLLWGRSVSLAELLAPMVGAALAITVALLRQKPVAARTLAIAAIGLLLWRQLQPFSWGEETGMGFTWIPLQAAFNISRESAIEILCLKTFLYWFAIRQTAIGFGIRMLHVAMAAALFLLISEFGQIYQAGRTPEITDPVIALLALVPLFGLDPRGDQGLNRVER